MCLKELEKWREEQATKPCHVYGHCEQSQRNRDKEVIFPGKALDVAAAKTKSAKGVSRTLCIYHLRKYLSWQRFWTMITLLCWL